MPKLAAAERFSASISTAVERIATRCHAPKGGFCATATATAAIRTYSRPRHRDLMAFFGGDRLVVLLRHEGINEGRPQRQLSPHAPLRRYQRRNAAFDSHRRSRFARHPQPVRRTRPAKQQPASNDLGFRCEKTPARDAGGCHPQEGDGRGTT
jgi:hypothetical protein